MLKKDGLPVRVLYIVYWGAAEPLGRSLILPSVRRLAASGVRLTLVTFEKPADLASADQMTDIRTSLDQAGVEWIPLQYHKRPKVPATAFDVIQGCARGIAASLRTRPDIVHARTFIGGLIGLALAPLLRAKLIYHNEGYYPDEQVDAGVWRADSLPHRVAKCLEQGMYARADGIIALSERSRTEIENLPLVKRSKAPVIVVPSCVDTDHFRQAAVVREQSSDVTRFIYLGSVGGRYRVNQIGRFVALAKCAFKQVHLRILTGTDFDLVEAELEGCGLEAGDVSISRVPYADVPAELSFGHAGLHFLSQGLSDHSGSPTKIGEYWAAGLPVVVTSGMGDTDEIIQSERVGIVVRSHNDSEYYRAVRDLLELLEDKELSFRCRRAAETHYALDTACERQFELYRYLSPRFRNDSARHSVRTC